MDIAKQQKIHKTIMIKPTPNETKRRTDSDNCFRYNSNNSTNFTRMKLNLLKIAFTLLSLFWIWMSIFFLYGCSANYHFTKFLKKGGKIENKTEYVTTTDTIRINGKDSVIIIRVPVQCPDVQIPPTRTEIRYKYKLQRDSIKTVRYVTKWKTKEVVKVAKSENKKPLNWFWIGLGVGIVSAVVIKLICKRL